MLSIRAQRRFLFLYGGYKVTLTAKQQKFVSEYIVSFNATQAAINAGYSEKTAYSIGHENLSKPEIANAIRGYLNGFAMSAEEVLFHLTEIARGDIKYVLNEWGAIDPTIAVNRGKSNLIKKYKTKTMLIEGRGENAQDQRIDEQEIEMYDRLTALGLLAKYHNLTNKVIIEDWRTEAITMIRNGQLEFKALSAEMGHDLATELFESAGVPVVYAGETTEGSAEE